MNHISKSALAKLVDRSPQYIDKVQKIFPPIVDFVELGKTSSGKPKIKVNRDGDLTKKFISEYIVKPPDPQKQNKPKKKPASQKNIQTESKPDQEEETPEPGQHATALKYGTEEKHELEKRKIKLQNEDLKLKIDQKRGNLVEKNLTDILFGKMYQIDSDQLKQLGSNLSPKLFRIISERNKIKANEICELLEIKNHEVKESIESMLNTGEKEIKTKIVGIFEEEVHSVLKSIKDEIDNFLDLLEADAI